MKKTITSITVGRLIPLFIVFMISIAVLVALNFRSIILFSMEDKILSLAEITKAGLTAHMNAGTMDKRDYFIHEISSTPNVQSLQIVRGDDVVRQFGRGLHGEKTATPFLRKVLNTKKPHYEYIESYDSAMIRAIVPYIASSKGNLNCLKCHHVSENTVLGAVDITLDVTQYRNKVIYYLLGLILVILMFKIYLIFHTSKIIDRFIRKPFLELIQLAQSVFYHSDTQKEYEFTSREFSEVAAHLINLGKELHERELRIKDAIAKFELLNGEIDTTLQETMFAMGVAEERRSQETHNHTRRVVEYCRLLGQYYGLESNDLNLLVSASPLHDVGKMGIPDSILLKPGALDETEREIMKMHAQMGYDILKHSQRDAILAAATIAYQHHEKWDGTGYPQQLSGENIHIFGRIVAVADVFDALMSKRPYKDPWDPEKVREFFKQEKSKAFDPILADLLLNHFEEFIQLHALYSIEEETRI